jgi:hypothetical protein
MRRTVASFVLPAVLSVIMPAAVFAAGHGSHQGGDSVHRAGTANVLKERRDRNHAGPLSYNAYWRAATSPAPPRPNQSSDRYWQKMQPWQQFHDPQR